jgi:lipoprotein-anchoring transpeptidase ErfK/SrfK
MANEESLHVTQTVQDQLKSAIEAAKAGRRKEAHDLLRKIVTQEPSNAVAWLWLAGVTDRPEEALAALDRVGELDPGHPRLEAARHWAAGQGVAVSRNLTSAWPRYVWVGLASLGVLVVACVLIWAVWGPSSEVQAYLAPSPTSDPSGRVLALQPELNRAVADARLEDAVAILQVMRALDPTDEALVHQLAQVSYQLALRRRDQGDLAGALSSLDEALALTPDDASLQRERRLLDAYQQGVDRHQTGDWQGTIRVLVPVHREDPNYQDVTELLYSSYYNLGLAQQAASDLVAAQASYQAAIELLPHETLARQKADEVALLLMPPTPTPLPVPTPTPTPGPQRIVVDVSEQRMYVYEGEELRWKWVVSTGEPGRPTALGNFAIQSKIPMAYASTWNLDMPYWLGIYWSGPLENGIHALPIQRATGYKLWDGFLGQRVSYGCVILSDENAETLFDWVEMGTPVVIQP